MHLGKAVTVDHGCFWGIGAKLQGQEAGKIRHVGVDALAAPDGAKLLNRAGPARAIPVPVMGRQFRGTRRPREDEGVFHAERLPQALSHHVLEQYTCRTLERMAQQSITEIGVLYVAACDK